MMKIKGISIWIWLLGFVVSAAAAVVFGPGVMQQVGELSKPTPLEIVKEDAWRVAKGYEVRGAICNPRKKPVRNVEISYDLAGKCRGTVCKVGSVSAQIKYIPAGGTVDFTAVGTTTLMIEEFRMDPLKASVSEHDADEGAKP